MSEIRMTNLLISQPLFAIFEPNDSAVDEPQLIKQTSHRHIVAVRIDPEIPTLTKTPFKAKRPCTPEVSSRRDPVYKAIWLVTQPLPVNFQIDRFNLDIIIKHPNDLIIMDTNITQIRLNITIYNIKRRVRISPLIWITSFPHKIARISVNPANLRKIL